jgi:hypothetical protein
MPRHQRPGQSRSPASSHRPPVVAARNVAAQITFTPGTVISRLISDLRRVPGLRGDLALHRGDLAVEELDMAQASLDRL